MNLGELKKVSGQVPAMRDEAPDDVFMCAVSFEERSVQGATMLKEGCARTALVFQYEDTLDSSAGIVNGRRIRSALDKSCLQPPLVMPCEFSEPLSVVKVLERWLDASGLSSGQPRITVDITCFTKLHLLLLLRTLDEKFPQARMRVLYTEPLAYATAFGRKLSHGILDTFYIPLNSGDDWGKGSALILFLGHEPSRALRVIEEVEPDQIILVQGEPGFSEEMSRMSKRLNRYLLHRAEYNSEFNLGVCSTSQFIEVAQLLRGVVDLFRKAGKDTFYISPLGTKLQALGIDYLRRGEPSARLIVAYPTPLRYERKYFSQGMGPTYAALLIPISSLPSPEVVEKDGVYRLAASR